MSANLTVLPCSCPARDTLCSGGQMLSMSQMGQKLPWRPRNPTSALPPKADSSQTSRHVRKVPWTDSCAAAIANAIRPSRRLKSSSEDGTVRSSAFGRLFQAV